MITSHPGSNLQTPAVLNVPYRNAPPSPWPRILQIIAVLTLIFGAVTIATAAGFLKDIWPLTRASTISATLTERIYWTIGGMVQVVAGALVIIGAAKALRRGSYRLIVVGFLAMVAFWPVTFMISVILRPASQPVGWVLISILWGAHYQLFPVLVLLLLRAHRAR